MIEAKYYSAANSISQAGANILDGTPIAHVGAADGMKYHL